MSTFTSKFISVQIKHPKKILTQLFSLICKYLFPGMNYLKIWSNLKGKESGSNEIDIKNCKNVSMVGVFKVQTELTWNEFIVSQKLSVQFEKFSCIHIMGQMHQHQFFERDCSITGGAPGPFSDSWLLWSHIRKVPNNLHKLTLTAWVSFYPTLEIYENGTVLRHDKKMHLFLYKLYVY